MQRFLWLLLLLLLSCVAPAASEPPAIAISLSPTFSYAPVTLRAQITIEPHPRNKEYCIEVYSELVNRASCRSLDARSARTYFVEYPKTPPGHYRLVASLLRDDKVHTAPAAVALVLDSIPQ